MTIYLNALFLQAQAEQTRPVNRLAQDQPYSVVKAEYEAVVSELEKQVTMVTSLQQEKDELTALLAQATTTSVDLQQQLELSNAQLAEFRSAQLRDAREKNTTEMPIDHFGSLVEKLTTDKEKLQQQLDVALQNIQELRAQPLPVELVRRFPHLDETFVVLNRYALVISELKEMFSSRPSQTGEEGFAPSSMRKNLITSRLPPSSSIQNSEGEVAEQDPNDVRSFIQIF